MDVLNSLMQKMKKKQCNKKEVINMKNINEKKLSTIYRMEQPILKEYVTIELKRTYGDAIIKDDGFVFAKGTLPILLVAHMDTVHKESVKAILSDGHVWSSPQGIGGDDRNGIYSVLEIIKTHKCSVLFTEDEEIGGVGAHKFTKTELCKSLKGKFNYIIELDRKGNDDAVFYECDNPDFTKFITKEFFKEAHGSYSDICTIAPVLGCAAVNLSTAYYKAHTTEEFVVLKELDVIIDEVRKLIDRTNFDTDKFEYIELTYDGGWYGFRGMCGYGYGYGKHEYENENCYKFYYIEFMDEDGDVIVADYDALNEYEAIGIWTMDYPNLCANNIISMYNTTDGVEILVKN